MSKRAKPNKEFLENLKKEDAKRTRPCNSRITPPTLEDWTLVCEVTRGRVGKIAEAFDVSVHTIYKWRDQEEGFEAALNAPREIAMDKLTEVAELLAIGVPDIDPDTGRFLGWREPPREATLHKLLDTYGMMRGFGRNPQEVNLNIKDGSVPIAKWLELNTQDKAMGAIDDEDD